MCEKCLFATTIIYAPRQHCKAELLRTHSKDKTREYKKTACVNRAEIQKHVDYTVNDTMS